MTDKMNLVEQISLLLNQLKEKRPLIHYITNYVTVNDCANITLALCASPIMADDIREVEEITSQSQALVLNIGTLNEKTVASMILAAKKANTMHIPVILDPVGAGASKLRSETVLSLLNQIHFSVIRGNMSEILFLAGLEASARGVDASESDLASSLQKGIFTTKTLATKLDCTIAITGATDIVSDGKQTFCIENGHPMLSSITGTGCMCTALIGCACGVATDYNMAALAGILFMGIAGEAAYKTAGQSGNGSFRTALIDHISLLTPGVIQGRSRIYEAQD